jgi:hypothetical protein
MSPRAAARVRVCARRARGTVSARHSPGRVYVRAHARTFYVSTYT